MNSIINISNKQQYIQIIENKFYQINLEIYKNKLKVGDFIFINYSILEEKKKIQSSEGLIINIKGIGIKKTYTIRRNLLGINLEQKFFLYSPNIVSIFKKYSFKIKHAKLFFIRKLHRKLKKL